MIPVDTFLNKVQTILERPGMFGIHHVEDLAIVFFSEIFMHKNVAVEEWSSKFSDFVIKETRCNLQNFSWSKIIRLYSGSDYNSLELFKELCLRFTDSQSSLEAGQ